MLVNYFKIKISLMRLDIKKCFVFDYEIFQMYEKKTVMKPMYPLPRLMTVNILS